MKRNFNKPVLGFNGKPLTDSNKKPQTMGDLIALQLYSVGVNDSATPEKKLQAYRLLSRLTDAKGEIEITTEEGTLIKEVVGRAYAAGVYGQIYDYIEKG